MAPEVALKKDYQKSVDVWAIGVILYMLLTGGTHPIYTEDDTVDSFKEKLKNLDNFLPCPLHISK